MSGDLGIAMRNLARRRGRYATLGAAIALGCAAAIVVVGALGGMRSSMLDKAAVYYGGDFSLHGLRQDGLEMIPGADRAVALLEAAAGGGASVSARIVDRSAASFIFFGGSSVRLKMMTGVDWAKEGRWIERLNFVSGGVEGSGRDSILVSEPMAETLGAKVGDDILVLANTGTGQKNTRTAVLGGIFRDSSFLGAGTVYLSSSFLRGLVAYPEGAATEIAVRFAERSGSPAARIDAVQAKLSRALPMFSLAPSREALFTMQADERWEGTRYAILSLDAHVGRISQVSTAIAVALYALVALLFGIVALGVSNTYRVVVQERTREIGTMRALGMQRGRVARLILTEALCLSVASAILGLGLGILALEGLGSAPLSRIPGLDVFLSDGRLSWALDAGSLAAHLRRRRGDSGPVLVRSRRRRRAYRTGRSLCSGVRSHETSFDSGTHPRVVVARLSLLRGSRFRGHARERRCPGHLRPVRLLRGV